MILFKSKAEKAPRLAAMESHGNDRNARQHCRSLFQYSDTQWLAPVQISAQTVTLLAQRSTTVAAVGDILSTLDEDDYLRYMRAYYQSGLSKFGEAWNYADLLTFLHASTQLVRPRSYLEIGVRRGRSMAIVAATTPDCAIYGFDLWVQNYAGMPNPGPDFVRAEMKKQGHHGTLELVSGDSHATVPRFLEANPSLQFDLVNVDGDHSEAGARLDLECVIPRVALGGILLLDDITHPQHTYLEQVWDDMLGAHADFHTVKYRELGYGVAVAVRRN